MPRKGPAYPIDTEWRDRVRAAINARKISDAEFARRAKISKAALSEALHPDSIQTTLAPAIHRALGWPPPRPILMSEDDEELWRVVGKLDARDKARLLERALTLEEERKKKS